MFSNLILSTMQDYTTRDERRLKSPMQRNLVLICINALDDRKKGFWWGQNHSKNLVHLAKKKKSLKKNPENSKNRCKI